ncbi:MAG TPA: MarR family transcriptional regulator [Spirochaetota bacterium]
MKPDQIISLISQIHENANRIITEELASHGIEGLVPSHGGIMVCLFRNDRIPMSELARIIHRKKNTVTVLVEKLESHGYISRLSDPDDSRITLIALTPKGRSIKDNFRKISDKLITRTYKGISAEEKETLVSLLSRICENLNI